MSNAPRKPWWPAVALCALLPFAAAAPAALAVPAPQVSPETIARGQALCQQADKLLAEEKPDEALKFYQEALKLLPLSKRARQGIEACRAAMTEDSAPATEPAPAAAPGEWPGWLGPARDGKSPDRGLLKQWPAEGPPLLWQANGIGQGYSGVAVSGGVVYITGNQGGKLTITALDMEGKRAWSATLGNGVCDNVPGSRATPTIDGGSLYLLSDTGTIGCLDAKSGEKRWTHDMREYGGRPPEWGYAESVLIHKDLAIITPGGSNCIVALNKKTGQTVWTSSGFSAPAHYGSCIAVTYRGVPMIIAGTGGGLFGVSARDGSLLWSNRAISSNTANCPTPAYSDGYVFWANGYGKGGVCVKLRVIGGRVRATQAWTTRDMDCHHGGYIIEKGRIYGNHDGGWVCLDLQSGRTLRRAEGVGKGSLCYADGMLYLFSDSGGQAALATCSPAGLEIRGRVQVAGQGNSWAHPVVIGGRLYLRYDDNLYCYNVKAP